MEHHHKRYVTILSLAALCLAFSVYLELALHGEWAGPIETPETFLEAGESFFRELGFALIIAWMISVGIETHARMEDGRRAESLRRLIAVDVFKGVFSDRLPRTYIDRVAELHLYPAVIRETMQAKLSLWPLSQEQERDWNLPSGRFLLLVEEFEYVLRNTSTGLYRHILEAMIPTHSGSRAGIAQVTFLQIGDRVYTREEITDSEKNDQAGTRKSYGWDIELQSGEEIRVKLSTQLLKEISDTGLWSSFIPTMKANLGIVSHVDGLSLGVRSTGPSLKPVPAEGEQGKAWEFTGPILKNESVVFWWRPNYQ